MTTPDAEPRSLRIGQVADRVGVNPKTIRYYEQVGLLPEPRRTTGQYRVYDDEAVARLAFIRSAQRFGLSLDEIREVLAFRDNGEPPCGHVVDAVRREADALDRRITELLALREEMRDLIARAEEQTEDRGPYCRLIEHRCVAPTSCTPISAPISRHRCGVGER